MAAKKRSKGPNTSTSQSAPLRFPVVLSTATRSVLNMLVVGIASGLVLVCLFAAKKIY